MRILVYTGFDNNGGYKEAGSISAINKAEYALRHGYDFLCNRNYDKFDRPISWFKIKEIIRLLPNYNYIFWSDADAIITNMTLSLESHLIDSISLRPKSVFVSPKIEPESIDIPNLIENNYIIAYDNYSPCMGNFLIKNCKWSIDFFKNIWDHTQYINDPIWDNRAQDNIFFNSPSETSNVKFVPKKMINSMIPDWTIGDFLIHFPATEHPRRVNMLNKYSEFIIR